MCKGRLPSYVKGSKNDAYLKRWHSLTRMFRYSRGAARPTVAHLPECTREHTHSQTHCRHSERWRENENIEKNLTGKESKEKSEDEKEDSSDTKPETGADTMERQTIKTVDATPDDGDGKNAMGRRS
ncbi:hypothetical protein C0Q70_08206 [Pomacea canaliculata]|uniref:Uncharacterized protein n=1 Tax=Pomacea canaliculata TaxID=400727 RepID=A0A2T7PH94_POMCA|nr:hypothetical protein C0Q70_08206 [Pomacea canaliculata]